MRILTILDPQRRAVHYRRLLKRALCKFRTRNSQSIPIFTVGMQRSGTSMLMNVLHLRADTEVFDESLDNRAFRNYQLRGFDDIEKLIYDSWADFVCFKPIVDSHQITEILDRFPNARAVWIYRSYKDVANSRLRKFPNATRAIRLICHGLSGGGWLDDGVSDDTRNVLRKFDCEGLTDFDCACLTWWARNRIVLEMELWHHSKVVIVNYEQLVATPIETFNRLFSLLQMPEAPQSLRHVHQASIGKNIAPDINSEIEALCDDLLTVLNSYTSQA